MSRWKEKGKSSVKPSAVANLLSWQARSSKVKQSQARSSRPWEDDCSEVRENGQLKPRLINSG